MRRPQIQGFHFSQQDHVIKRGGHSGTDNLGEIDKHELEHCLGDHFLKEQGLGLRREILENFPVRLEDTGDLKRFLGREESGPEQDDKKRGDQIENRGQKIDHLEVGSEERREVKLLCAGGENRDADEEGAEHFEEKFEELAETREGGLVGGEGDHEVSDERGVEEPAEVDGQKGDEGKAQRDQAGRAVGVTVDLQVEQREERWGEGSGRGS